MFNSNLKSRRDFLKRTAIASAFVVSLPEIIVSGQEKQSVSNDKIDDKKLILFQGDSITDCGRSRLDTGALMGQGYPVLVASRLAANYPGGKLKFMNRGISGHKVVDLAARWQADTIDLAPSILSILIGVNDVANYIGGNKLMDASSYATDYKSIIDKTLLSLPNVKLILCEPFLLPAGKVKLKAERYLHEIKLRQDIVRKLAETYQAILVPTQAPLEKACELAPAEYWVFDGVHPSMAGHEIIAREWIKATAHLFG